MDDEQRLTAGLRKTYHDRITDHASRGRRLLGVAVRKHVTSSSVKDGDVHELLFMGVLIISDPVREDVGDAIQETIAAGVAVKLITGDLQATARAVAQAVGLPAGSDVVLDGSDVEGMDDDELYERVDDTVVFSRIDPIDKQRIIKHLQARGHVVAMTGDGVNDAVALNSADIGIAMGSGRDIAKDASDLILLDNSFETIAAAIREGRVIRDNVRKVIAFLLSTNAAEVLLFLASILLGLPLPLLPAQVLWINIVTDGTSDLALSVEPEERAVMRRQPDDPSGSILSWGIGLHIVFSGLVMTVIALAGYWYALEGLGVSLDVARTLVFAFIATSSLLSTWSFRSLWETIWKRGLFANPWLFVSAGFSFGLTLLAIYHPVLQRFFHTTALSFSEWVVVCGAAGIAVLIIDARKLFAPLDEHAQRIQS